MEYFFVCPHCWQRISVVLDTSETHQVYVEDCEVCCKPIELEYTITGDSVREFEARSL